MKSPLVVGNWKMNGTSAETAKLAGAIAEDIIRTPSKATVVLAPPSTALVEAQKQIGASGILLGGQNCHWEDRGAFTGEVSPLMLRDAGCAYVIIGHSERRHIFRENDELIAKKLAGAMRNHLRPILCVGETLSERESGSTLKVITRQLEIALNGLEKNAIRNIEVAYEPVWAIGTGRNADPPQITEVHGCIRHLLRVHFGETEGNDVRLLYGGSVNPENAGELAKTAEVNGLLVGGASLKAETFLPVVRSFE